MSEIRHRHRILEAIDQLRRRKARPDVNRICSFMFRRFSVSCGETKSDLQKLIDAEIVIKVDYKGNTSYRNAAKWAMLPNYKSKLELDSTNTSSILSSAVAELIVLEPDYLDIGVPALELEKHLLKKDSRRFTKKNLDSILKREIDNGTLVKLENGNYFLGEHSNVPKQNNSQSNLNSSQKSANRTALSSKPKTKKLKPIKPLDTPPSAGAIRAGDISSLEERKEEQKDKMDETGANSNANNGNSENVGFRVGGRQKRAKVMFDPSDNNLPKVSRKKAPGRPPLNAVVKHVSSLNRSSSSNNLGSSNSTSNLNVNRSSSSASIIVGSSAVSPAKSFLGFTQTSSLPSSQSVNVPVNPSVCCLCHSYGPRFKGVPERLIICVDCTVNKAHPSCIESKRDNGSKTKNGLWLCGNCKRCTVCDESGKAGKIASCCSCYEAYHYICHKPHIPLNITDVDNWKCLKCSTSVISSSTSSLVPSSVISTAVTVINNSSSNTDIINNNSSNNNSMVIKEEIKEDIKPSFVNNVSPETIVTSSSGIVSSNNSCSNSNINNSSSSCAVVTSSLNLPNPSSTTSTIAHTSSTNSTNSGPLSVCGVSTVISSTSIITTTSASVSSSSTVSSRCGSTEFDESEDVKDVKDVKIVITNDFKENIQKNFTLPLNNNINNRISAYEKNHLPSSCLQDPYDGYPIDETIPDASQWSPQEVFQYFVKHFDPDTAKIFKDQDIDGQSLLLMKRADVLTGLCLKLGPALKVYSHVKKLQIRRSNPKLLWS